MESTCSSRYGIDPDALYDAKEATHKIRESKPTLARLRSLGIGPAYIKKRGKIIYPGFSLIEYLDAHFVSRQAAVRREG
ncbi:MAG: hypothetical protein ABJ084_03900 [Halioglobus sp.]